jgi:hypothetical protein
VIFVVNELIKGEIEKLIGQFIGLICDDSLTMRGLNSNSEHFSLFYLYICPCGESCLLVSWCAGDRYVMMDSVEDRGRSRRLNSEDR